MTSENAEQTVAEGLLESLVRNRPADEKLLLQAHFSTHDLFVSWATRHAEVALDQALEKFVPNPSLLKQGYQTRVSFSDDADFVVKQYMHSGTDIPAEQTMQNVALARERLGEFVTPFTLNYLHGEQVIVAKKITPIDSEYLKKGKSFVYQLQRLMEWQWFHGVFDPDIGINNLGLDGNNLVSFDFGRAMDAHDESIYEPAANLHNDPFHIAIDKLRDTIVALFRENEEAAQNMVESLEDNFGITFNMQNYTTMGTMISAVKSMFKKSTREKISKDADLLHCPRDDKRYEVLAGQLRKAVKEKRNKYFEKVSPIVDENVHRYLIDRINERISGVKTIGLYARELADLYALNTLREHLETVDLGAPFTLQFIGSERAVEHKDRMPVGVSVIQLDKAYGTRSLEMLIGTHSDIRGHDTIVNDLEIDIALLKNCAPPMASEEKQALREKYGITTGKPVMVIGYSNNDDKRIQQLVKEFHKKAHIVLVGGYSTTKGLPVSSGVTMVSTKGQLKDYYAIADIAINGCNLAGTYNHLHNFVEATEGGPLFIVKPQNTRQFGYKELVDLNVIREYKIFEEMVAGIYEYLESFKGTEEHCRVRAEHIQRTRDVYLPIFVSEIRQAIGTGPATDSPDLIAHNVEKTVRLKHSASMWSQYLALDAGLKTQYPPNQRLKR